MVAFFLSAGIIIIFGALLGRLTNNTTAKNSLAIVALGVLVALVALFFV